MKNKGFIQFIPLIIGGILIVSALGVGFYFKSQPQNNNFSGTLCYPNQGCVGLGTATAGDVGKYLKVSNNSPFTYTLDTPAGGAASDPFTHPAAGQSATTSLMLLNGQASTTQLTTTGSTYLATTGGKVGIGTTSPYSLLSISNNLNTTADTPLFTIASTTAGTATSTLLTVLANGKVGIGTAETSSYDPNAQNLVVVGSGNTGITIATTDTTKRSSLFFSDGTSGSAPYRGYFIYDHNGDFLRIGVNALEKMRIDSSGNVGIGTTTPTSILNIASTNPKLTLTDTNAISGSKHWYINSTNGDFVVGTTSDDLTSDKSYFQIASSTGTISAQGKVISPTLYPTFSYSTSTAWTGTTTIPLGVAVEKETWVTAYCYTDTGTVKVSFYDGVNRMTLVSASTAIASTTLATNNIFYAGDKRFVDIGTAATSPTKVSCTISKYINN